MRSFFTRIATATLACAATTAAVVGLSVGSAHAEVLPPPTGGSSNACIIKSGTYTNFGTPTGPRKAKIFVPAGANTNTPMIVSMHGATGSSESQENVTGFTTIAQRDNAIVVYPQANGTSPNTLWNPAPGSTDVAFVASLTAYMQASGCSNPSITLVNGFSQGAMMTSRLMCEYGKLYGGAAMVGGVLPPTPGCTVDKYKPIIVVHGQTDAVVLFDGTLPNAFLQALAGGPAISNYPGVNRIAMAGRWAKAKGCTASTTWEVVPGNVSRFDMSCRYSTTQAMVHSGAHLWKIPGFNTSEYIWAQERPIVASVGPQTALTPRDQVLFAAALQTRLATDAAFASYWTRMLTFQAKTDPVLAAKLNAALAAEIKAHPNGITAIRMREALSQP